jgi:hypothetical protein
MLSAAGRLVDPDVLLCLEVVELCINGSLAPQLWSWWGHISNATDSVCEGSGLLGGAGKAVTMADIFEVRIHGSWVRAYVAWGKQLAALTCPAGSLLEMTWLCPSECTYCCQHWGNGCEWPCCQSVP